MSSAKLHLNSVKSLDLLTLMQWRSQGVARVTKATRNPLYEKKYNSETTYSICNIHIAH